MNNILVVNVNWLGDATFSTPVFRALKKKYPRARISCLAVPRIKEILEHCPDIDEIIIYDEKGEHWYPWKKLELIFNLRKKKFDAAFLLHRSVTRAFLVFLAGIPIRVGYATKKRSGFLTYPILNAQDMHRSKEYAKVIEDYGIPVEDEVCRLEVSSKDISAVNEKLAKMGIDSAQAFIVINPSGNWDLKRWPAARFSLLINRLVRDCGAKILISGAEKDIFLAEDIARQSGVNPIIWAGQTTLSQLLALFKRAKVVISNDTGPLHLASSVGTDVIGLFGPTRPEITGPLGTGRAEIIFKNVGCNKAPCYHLNCPQNDCLGAITVDDVLQAYQKIRS